MFTNHYNDTVSIFINGNIVYHDKLITNEILGTTEVGFQFKKQKLNVIEIIFEGNEGKVKYYFDENPYKLLYVSKFKEKILFEYKNEFIYFE
jgi:hypothetical protein